MQCSSTFIKMSVLIPEVKKTGLINNWETTLAYWKESEQSKALGN